LDPIFCRRLGRDEYGYILIRSSLAKIIICLILVVVAIAAFFYIQNKPSKIPEQATVDPKVLQGTVTSPEVLPDSLLLENGGHYAPQTFNNCAPAALSMGLAYYGIYVDQQTLANVLRPNNNTSGKNDEKSTPPELLAKEGERYGLLSYYRPNGSIELLKKLNAAGFPVVVRTRLNTKEDYAHYRVVRGYNDTSKVIIQEDGYEGENVAYSYQEFMQLWSPFNTEYVVFATPEKKAKLESILGNDTNELSAWKGAVAKADNPFVLSVALYHVGDYEGSVSAFEKAEPALTEHLLWYQIEPIKSLYEVGKYDKVISLANEIFDRNGAYTELYVVVGKSYLKQGNTIAARTAFETALRYNKNFKSAQDALAAMQ
jgi:tetratricopeptide (TPR) repeat protein